SATVNITVNDEAPDISYNPDWFVLTNNTAMSPTATPTNSGGAIPSGIIDQPSQVGSGWGEGRSNSMAVDSNGVAHVVYSLYYATNANGSWVATMMATAPQFYQSNGASIVIDANDTIHISYSFKKNSGSLIYSTCSSSCSSASSWSSVQVGSGGYNNNIAIDTNGTLHISHSTSSSLGASLQHSTCSSSCSTASSWTTTSILTSSTIVISSISMTTDSNNSIHMLYREGYGNPTIDLNYATCSSGCTSASSWSIVEIDTSTTTTFLSRQSIAVDSNNGIHITYGLNGNLTYATCSSSCTSASSWTNTTVDTTTPFGKGEIALDSNDHLYISYGKGSSFGASKLAYATCSSSCTSSSSWTNTTFDTKGGTERDLVLDSNDRVHISYHTSSTDKSLRYLAIEPSSIVYAYSISPPLPAGLSLEISTGKISGTPTELSTNTTYTITARNSGGVNTTTITIEVIDQIPTLSYSPNTLVL
ncbi:MAG: putative Ig domain-containing protein, partial [Candidatus Poseidoniaceae archaeon]